MNDRRSDLIQKHQKEEWQDYEQRGWIALYRAGRVNRVTRNVFHYFMAQSRVQLRLHELLRQTLKPLYQAISALSKLRPDAQGCRKGSYCNWDIWLVPDRRDGLTMMFPEDYRSDHQVPAGTRTRGESTPSDSPIGERPCQ